MDIEGVEVPTESSFRMPGWLWASCIVAIAVGLGGLIVSFIVHPLDGWLWLLVETAVFLGIINGMLIWAATFRVAKARWAGAVNRLAHSAIYVTPVVLGVLIVLLAGAGSYQPWISHPIPAKQAWLNQPFMVVRQVFSLGLLWVLCALMVRRSLSADAIACRGERISEREQSRVTVVSTAAVLWYPIAGTIVAYDFIMSLSPRWYSSMFGPYIWVTNLNLAMAVLILMAALLRKPLGAGEFLGPERFHDMGNLLLGFSLFSMGLFFAQYLTIWYENLPEETFFIILRYDKGPWVSPAWTSFLLGYAIPFVLLQSVRLKKTPALSAAVAVLVILGIVLERYILIVPSLAPTRLVIHPAGALGFLAFAGVFVLATSLFLSKYSPVSASQVALKKTDMRLEVTS